MAGLVHAGAVPSGLLGHGLGFFVEQLGKPFHHDAAQLLGITRATLRKRIEKFGILRELTVK